MDKAWEDGYLAEKNNEFGASLMLFIFGLTPKYAAIFIESAFATSLLIGSGPNIHPYLADA